MAVETRFPRWADNPPQFLIWELDELMPVMLCLVISLPTRNILGGLIVGVVLMRIYRKMRDRLPAYFYVHYPWFWGIWQPKSKSVEIPKGYISRYRE